MLSYPGCHVRAVHWLYWNLGIWSSSDIIILSKWRHHVIKRLPDLMNKNAEFKCEQENKYIFVWGWDRKVCPSDSPFVITPQASWCQKMNLRTDFPIPPSLIMDSDNICLAIEPLDAVFILLINVKMLMGKINFILSWALKKLYNHEVCLGNFIFTST